MIIIVLYSWGTVSRTHQGVNMLPVDNVCRYQHVQIQHSTRRVLELHLRDVKFYSQALSVVCVVWLWDHKTLHYLIHKTIGCMAKSNQLDTTYAKVMHLVRQWGPGRLVYHSRLVCWQPGCLASCRALCTHGDVETEVGHFGAVCSATHLWEPVRDHLLGQRTFLAGRDGAKGDQHSTAVA